LLNQKSKLEIPAILDILEERKSLFPWIFGFPDHPQTVEVAGMNPAPPIGLTANAFSLCACYLHSWLRRQWQAWILCRVILVRGDC